MVDHKNVYTESHLYVHFEIMKHSRMQMYFHIIFLIYGKEVKLLRANQNKNDKQI